MRALLSSPLALMLLVTPLLAETPAAPVDQAGTNRVERPDPALQPVGQARQAVLAQELFALGMVQNDALTVLAAARLAQNAAPATGGAIKKTTGGESSSEAAEATVDVATDPVAAPADAAVMFAKARDLAGEDAALLALIADAEAEASRGAVGGAQAWPALLGPGQSDVYEIAFTGNHYAEVAVSGNGAANLDMVITDQNGNIICYDVSPSDQIYCDFVPAWDGFFYITIENAGEARNSYALVTN